MNEIKQNFLEYLKEEGRKRVEKIPRFLFYPIVGVVIFLGIFLFQVVLSDEPIGDVVQHIPIFGNALSLGSERMLNGEKEDRINILLLGMGGVGHPGPYLTDTMMIASIRPSDHKLSLISLPRDLSLPMGTEGWNKINTINAYAEAKQPGTGGEATAKKIGELFGIPIHYYVRVDFSGFSQLIDELGGIKVYVDTGFSDHEFPDENYGYRTVSFAKGWQKMDGATALSYVRSRHGSNGESSDFARSQRQQKVLKAVKDDALSVTTFLNLGKISHILDIYRKNVNTNLDSWEIYKLAKLERQFSDSDISVLVLDDHPSSPLFTKTVNGAYMLLPKDETLGQLRDIVGHAFETPIELKKKERVVLDVRNGTYLEGLATKKSELLRQMGYTVAHIGNAQKKNYEKTVIYDLTGGQKPNALEELKIKLEANVSTELPAWLQSADEQGNTTAPTDFIIILGTNQKA